MQNCPQSGIAGKRLCPGRVEALHCIVGAGFLRDDSAVVVPELHLELWLLVGGGRPLEIVKLSTNQDIHVELKFLLEKQ